jgi:hypothetical protein
MTLRQSLNRLDFDSRLHQLVLLIFNMFDVVFGGLPHLVGLQNVPSAFVVLSGAGSQPAGSVWSLQILIVAPTGLLS